MPSIGSQELVILFILLGIPALAAYFGFAGRKRTYLASMQTSLPEDEVLEIAEQTYSSRRYRVASQTDQHLTFTKAVSPNIALAILLFLFGIVPGLLYLALAHRSVLVSIGASPTESGAFVTIVSSLNGSDAKKVNRRFLSSLPADEEGWYEDIRTF